jgi:uncharacterized protein YeaO (DUF488 family)
MMQSGRLRIKRVYDAPSEDDGARVLVDRIWPRGLAKPRAAVDLWLREIAPSDALRKWFGHDPARWDEFRARYTAELASHGDEVARLRALMSEGPVTVVYGAKDEAHNNAVALVEYLLARDDD